MSYHSVQLKKKVFELLPQAKEEFLRHHPEWDIEMLSNSKIIHEALKFYIATGKRV